ncbi:MAG: hypothetical protein VX397_01735 [Pseudomonadota bacterium]|nr:hypothetical protein [Pseudomonadota bacterium]
MFRVFITYLIPLLLPISVYLVWFFYRSSYVRKHGGSVPPIEKGPWLLLLVIGVFLSVAAMFFTALVRGSDPDVIYVPPRYQDGVVIPGQVEEKNLSD